DCPGGISHAILRAQDDLVFGFCYQFQEQSELRQRRFNAAKGYGFIQRSTGDDVLVHYSAIQSSGYRSLDEGSRWSLRSNRAQRGCRRKTSFARNPLTQSRYAVTGSGVPEPVLFVSRRIRRQAVQPQITA